MNFIEFLSSPEFGLRTVDNKTVAELVALNDRAREKFKAFYNSIHTDNTGASNRGDKGEIVEWEVVTNKTSNTLEDTSFEGKPQRNFREFRATKERGLDKNTRPQVSLFRFYTRFIKDAFFSMLKGKDIYRSTGKSSWEKIYGFLNTAQMWNLYRDEFVKNGLVPIASRGEDAKMILSSVTEKTNEAAKNVRQYVRNEIDKWKELQKSDPEKWNYIANYFKNVLSSSYLSLDEMDFVQHVFKGKYDIYQEHWIARHEALKELFGSDYIFMDPQTIMKRIKIPFTPVYTSDTLPDRRVMYFDGNGAKLKIFEAGKGERIVELTQDIDGTMQYIGDGQTITSERVFQDDYPEHFGTHADAKRAKTVQYLKDGDNVHMAKHQEMSLDLNKDEVATLVNNKGEEIATIAMDGNGQVNIYDMDGNDIDYLMSNDEAKVRSGDLSQNDVIHTIPGKSIGMIQFSPASQKQVSKFSTQLSYYFDEVDFQNSLMSRFLGLDQGKMSPRNLIKRLINLNKSGDEINKAVEDFSINYYDVVPQNVEELAKLRVGRHPSILNFLKDVLKKKILEPISGFNFEGSHLDFRADFKGRVTREETIIGANNGLVKKIIKKMGKQNHIYRDFDEKIEDINRWLSENEMYTMIVRSPVASSVGFGLYRIKNIDANIGDSFIIHPSEVKERFEGDHDHDTGHLIWLDEEFYNELKPHMRKTKGLNISQYKRQSKDKILSDLSGGIDMIRDMTYGETAIGEIVNVSRYAGVLNNMFGEDGSMTFAYNGVKQTIKIRPLDMQVIDTSIKKEDGKVFKGELRELLRLYLQASVDHPKVLLLRDWNYTQAKLLDYLFYDPANPNAPLDEDLIRYIKDGFIDKVLRLNQEIDNQHNNVGKSIKFDEIFEKSGQYASFVADREGYLKEVYEDLDESRIDPTKIEKGPGFQFIGAEFKEGSDSPTSLQELVTVTFDSIVDISGGPASRWFNIDSETIGSPVHKTTVRNIKHIILEEIKEESGGNMPEYADGLAYAQKLSNALYKLYERKKAEGGDQTDQSFLSKMSAKSWDYSDMFIEFYKSWSKEFDKLDPVQQKIATLSFLAGMAHGKRSTQRIDLRMLPPIKEFGATTLNPDVIKTYFKEYNKLIDEAYADSKRLQEMKETKPTKMVSELKKEFNCA